MIVERDPDNPAYDFVPDDQLPSLPSLYETERTDDPIARIKLFTPDSSWTWYITEFDVNERICFGIVVGHEREFGYFSLAELEELRGPLGLPVERDLHFTPKPVSECS